MFFAYVRFIRSVCVCACVCVCVSTCLFRKRGTCVLSEVCVFVCAIKIKFIVKSEQKLSKVAYWAFTDLKRFNNHWWIWGGACQVHAHPTGPNSFVFAHIFAEKHPHWRSTPPNGSTPPLREILDPPLTTVPPKYVKLKYCGVREDMLCYFCNRVSETILHLFLESPRITRFWQEVISYLTNNCNKTRFQVSAQKIIFNEVVKNPYDYLNTICLIVKQY